MDSLTRDMTEKKTKSVRLPTDIAQEVETRAEDRGISESDMLRRLIVAGLDDRDDEIIDRLDNLENLVENYDDDYVLTIG
jgi:hypothetical protein